MGKSVELLFLCSYVVSSVFGNCGIRIILLDDTPCKGDQSVYSVVYDDLG